MKKITVAAVAVCMAWVFAGTVSATPKMMTDAKKKACADCHSAKPETKTNLTPAGVEFQKTLKK